MSVCTGLATSGRCRDAFVWLIAFMTPAMEERNRIFLGIRLFYLIIQIQYHFLYPNPYNLHIPACDVKPSRHLNISLANSYLLNVMNMTVVYKQNRNIYHSNHQATIRNKYGDREFIWRTPRSLLIMKMK